MSKEKKQPKDNDEEKKPSKGEQSTNIKTLADMLRKNDVNTEYRSLLDIISESDKSKYSW